MQFMLEEREKGTSAVLFNQAEELSVQLYKLLMAVMSITTLGPKCKLHLSLLVSVGTILSE